MIGFLLKKYIFDFWDNLFFVIALNMGFLFLLTLNFILFRFLPAAGIILFVISVYCLFVYICSAASVLKDVSDYRRPGPAALFANLKGALKPAAVFFALFALVFFILRITIPAYFKMGTFLGMAAAFFSCWICLFIVGSFQFYPAVYYRLGMQPLKCIKKCAIIFFDNTGFCLFTLFFNIIFTVPVFLFPGCPLLFSDEALRLRLLKYDWLEQGRNRTKIPWAELLEEENKKTGKRTWRSFIFPWKD